MNHNRSLLVIDDEVGILEIISELLDGVVDTVYIAENGKEGLTLLESHPEIDCVICDIQMPIMGGAQTIKNARSLGFETPFIFYTGYGDDEVFREVAKYGIFDFLDKPKFNNLIEVVSRGIEHGFNSKNNLSEEDNPYKKILDSLK